MLGRSLPLAVLLALTNVTWAAEPILPLTPDRPGFTNGADTVVPKATQIEFGAALTNFNGASGTPQTFDFPELLLRTGLKPHLELRLGLPNYVKPKGQSSGFGDANVGIKYQTYVSKDGSTKFALIPALTIPTGNSDFGSGHVDPLLTLAAQTTSGARWGLSANLQMADPTQNGTRTPEVAPAFSSSYQMTANWSAYADLYDNFVRGDKPSPIVDGGLTYLASSELQYDVEVGCGLGGSAPVRFIGAGVSLRVR